MIWWLVGGVVAYLGVGFAAVRLDRSINEPLLAAVICLFWPLAFLMACLNIIGRLILCRRK